MGKALASLGLNLLSTTMDWIHYCKSKHTTTKFPIIFTILMFFKNDNCVGGVNLTALFIPNWTAVTLVYLTCYMQTLFQRKLAAFLKPSCSTKSCRFFTPEIPRYYHHDIFFFEFQNWEFYQRLSDILCEITSRLRIRKNFFDFLKIKLLRALFCLHIINNKYE